MATLLGRRSSDPVVPPISKYIREAVHAGSWYSSEAPVLCKSLQEWVVLSPSPLIETLKAGHTETSIEGCIVPHAGYSYCGSTGGLSMHGLHARLLAQRVGAGLSDTSTWITTIVILHPSHHIGMNGVGLQQGCAAVATPLGDLRVLQVSDLEAKFRANGVAVHRLTKDEDEAEHSSEMMYPMIKFILNDIDASYPCDASVPSLAESISILPIMVGSASHATEQSVAKVLLDLGIGSHSDRSVFTVVSSDFCHYGSRFGYTPTPSIDGQPLFQFIQALDEQGMEAISGGHSAFSDYLKATRNTICGRHPIGTYLALQELRAAEGETAGVINWVDYKQSSKAVKKTDSSVSYAGAIIVRR